MQEECAPCQTCKGTGFVKDSYTDYNICPSCKGINPEGIEYMGIPVGTVKKTATGKGNASKEDMMRAARERWPGWEPVDDNDVDARWIAVAAAREVSNE